MVERTRRHALQHDHLTHIFFPSHCRKGALKCHPPPFFLSILATLSVCNVVCVVCRTKVLSPWLVCGWCYKLKVSRKPDQITKRFLSMEVFNLGLVQFCSNVLGDQVTISSWRRKPVCHEEKGLTASSGGYLQNQKGDRQEGVVKKLKICGFAQEVGLLLKFYDWC
jgi:hypothetical protein